uniref:Uncharacterized protein n=1 Tax=Spodoptera exigua multiple nucleopolyhedrovirus TaxID=10454 RepID=A0A6N0C2F3_9ABAC|nr:hypothetical protein [Spodoptera exigua multiple nucleopolyhedrovirus]
MLLTTFPLVTLVLEIFLQPLVPGLLLESVFRALIDDLCIIVVLHWLAALRRFRLGGGGDDSVDDISVSGIVNHIDD